LLLPVIPRLQQLQKEPGGQEVIQRYTYYLAVPMALFQAYSQIKVFNYFISQGGGQIPIIPGFGGQLLLTLSVLASMTAGTMFAVWLGDLITEQGIGNGVSLIIFSGIVSGAPNNLASLLSSSVAHRGYHIGVFVVVLVVSVTGAILIQEGMRRIPVQYGKRVRGRKQYGGASTHIPLRLNPVGMIPLIFSQAFITFPALLGGLLPSGGLKDSVTNNFGNQQGWFYWTFFFLLTVGFTFFYAEVMISNRDLADNLQRHGGFIPGIRPGRRTQEYILRVTRRITLVGALFLGVIAIVPGIVGFLNQLFFPVETVGGGSGINAARVISGSGVIIVVGVVIDFMRQLEAQLVMRNYEGFMRR